MTCGYCTQRATSQIPSIPADVCLTHAIEYWTGLLACARDQPVCEQAPGADASERAADDAPKAGIRRSRMEKSRRSAAGPLRTSAPHRRGVAAGAGASAGRWRLAGNCRGRRSPG